MKKQTAQPNWWMNPCLCCSEGFWEWDGVCVWARNSFLRHNNKGRYECASSVHLSLFRIPGAWPLLVSAQSLPGIGLQSSPELHAHPIAAGAASCSSTSSALWLGPGPATRPIPAPYKSEAVDRMRRGVDQYLYSPSPSFSFETITITQYHCQNTDLVQEISDFVHVFVEVDVPECTWCFTWVFEPPADPLI